MVFRERLPDGSVLLTGQIPLTMDRIWPVGSIYMSVNNVNPGTLFGGTWVAWGSGMVPVGVNSADPSFDTVEKVGGEKNHTLTDSEMPSTRIKTVAGTGGGGAGTALVTIGQVDNTNPGASGNNYGSNRFNMGFGGGEWATLNVNGGGQGHNNLQPYITCYMWKRTA